MRDDSPYPMNESLVFQHSRDGSVRLLSGGWSPSITITEKFLDYARQGKMSTAFQVDGDDLIFTVENGRATYRLCPQHADDFACESRRAVLVSSREILD